MTALRPSLRIPVPRTDRVTPGLRANWRQFALLVAINAFVGATVGLERSVVPLLAEHEFGITSRTAAVAFIASFGLAKALTNLAAGRLARRFTRRSVLVAGWLVGIPVPLLLITAPSWGWVIAANLLLGVNQGLTWSMTVNMKIDLAGPRRRGLALGLNEAAGYLAVAAAAFLAGVIAERYGLRPEPFYLGIVFVAAGTALSVLFARDTTPFLAVESRAHGRPPGPPPSLRRSFAEVSWRRRPLFGVSQAGLVNNFNDALAWGILPLLYAVKGLDLGRIALLAAVYPVAWGSLQLVTGWASDRIGRQPLIVAGMIVQAVALAVTAFGDSFRVWLAAMALLGLGTALAYPVLLAAVGDLVRPEDRADALGVYRFWRDSGAMLGALAAGALADLFGFAAAINSVAVLTAFSGVIVMLTLRRRLPRPAPRPAAVSS